MLHREEKKEEGDRGGQEEKGGNQKERYRSSQSILKEISPEYSLEGLMLKLKLQCCGHLMRRTDSLGKHPDAGKE